MKRRQPRPLALRDREIAEVRAKIETLEKFKLHASAEALRKRLRELLCSLD